MVAFDVFVAAGRAEAGDGGVGGIGVVEIEHAQIAEAGEAFAEADAFAPFGEFGGFAEGGLRFRENAVLAKSLGEFLDPRGGGIDGGGGQGGQREPEGDAAEEKDIQWSRRPDAKNKRAKRRPD